MTTRRSFTSGLGAALASGNWLSGSRAAAGGRPNILWLSCEDMSPLLGCYGDPCAHSPNIDRLASEGVCYTNAFTVAGVCAPSRSGIISGMYPTTLGSHHMRCEASIPDFVRCFPEYLRRAGYYCTNNQKTDYNFSMPKESWDESSRAAHWKNRKSGQPFFAVFNHEVSHESRVVLRGEKYAAQVDRLRPEQRQDPARLKLPPYYPDTPETRRDWANHYELNTAMDYQIGDKLKELDAAGLREDTIVFYWSDHGSGLPRAKRWLYESGTRAALVVRVPERFRQPGQAAPGSKNDELVSFLDLGPTVLNLAGVPVPGHMQSRAFLGAGLKPPRTYVHGARDRMDERYDIIRAVRDKRFRYIRNYESYKPYYQYINTSEKGPTMREIRRAEAEGRMPAAAKPLMAASKPSEELYDVTRDPHEIRNLAGDPAYRKELERLRAEQQRWAAETKDLGLIPEPEIVEREKKYGSRHAILRQPGSDKVVDRILVVMNAAEEGKAGWAKLDSAMGDPDAAVRYWAAIGYGNQGKAASHSAPAMKKALRDPSAVVRIAAARALCRMDQPAEALPVLAAELGSPQEWVRLNAAIVLDEAGGQARPVIGALKKAMEDKENKYVVRVVNHALNALEGTSNEVP